MKKYAFLILLSFVFVFLLSCSSGEEAVMVVGGNKVYYDEYRYFYMNFRDSYEENGEENYSDKLKNDVEDALRVKYAKQNLAKEKELVFTDDQLDSIEQMKAYYVDYYNGKENFIVEIEKNHVTYDFFEKLVEFKALDELLREYAYNEFSGMIISDDKTLEQYIYSNFIHATHILILNDENEDSESNKALAEEICARAQAGEDFDSLILEYNEDPGMSDGDTVGYYFVEGQLLKAFEDAAMSLEIGEISDVVLSENGYHIIKRLPLDEDYIDEYFEDLRIVYKAKMYNDMIDTLADEIEVEYTDYYTSFTDDMLVNNIRGTEKDESK